MRNKSIFVLVAVVAILFAFVDHANAVLVNVCLAGNGGILVEGPEAIRDGDWNVAAQSVVGQGGSITSIIIFPEYSITHIGYKAEGRAWQYDGSASADFHVYLRIDDSWTQVGHWHAEGWGQYDVFETQNDNGGLGWNNVTGMKLYSSIWGWDVGSASATHHEMDAWAIPEPSTLLLLGLGGLAVLRKHRSEKRKSKSAKP